VPGRKIKNATPDEFYQNLLKVNEIKDIKMKNEP